ncbi:hypothetical protein PtB15_5B773 [Puccinia triticina]|nr:hypothetical protein PtB15_5B773 [Puccinia triticina]
MSRCASAKAGQTILTKKTIVTDLLVIGHRKLVDWGESRGPAHSRNAAWMDPPHSKPSQYPPHIQTRISKLHEMGIYGQGVKVALIDDGIDCAHPAFGSGFGLGFKIGFGKSFVNDDGDGIGKATSGASHSPCTPCGVSDCLVILKVTYFDQALSCSGMELPRPGCLARQMWATDLLEQLPMSPLECIVSARSAKY